MKLKFTPATFKEKGDWYSMQDNWQNRWQGDDRWFFASLVRTWFRKWVFGSSGV